MPDRSAQKPRTPLRELFREHGKTIVLGMLMIMGQTIPVYSIVYFMPSYATRVMHLPALTGYMASASSAFLLMVIPPLAGRLLDRLPRRKPVALVASGCTTLLVFPVFLMATRATSALPIIAGAMLVSVTMAFSAVAIALLVLEALPARVRASGMAVAQAFNVALFGGTAQFIVTGLIKWTGDPLSAAWYVAPACATSFCAIVLFRERRG
jgi:MHS family proline/betaine transporter-like MFS transporter